MSDRGSSYWSEPRSWPAVLTAWLVAIAVIAVGYLTGSAGTMWLGWFALAAVVAGTVVRAAVIVTRQARAQGQRAGLRDYGRHLLGWLLP